MFVWWEVEGFWGWDIRGKGCAVVVGRAAGSGERLSISDGLVMSVAGEPK